MAEEGLPAGSDFRIVFDGWVVSEDTPISALGIFPGAELWLTEPQKGGKPVIYLFPPSPLDALVRLSLAPQWNFDAVYPIVPVQTSESEYVHQVVEWAVSAMPNGDLKEKSTGLNISYLFWEAT